MTSDLPEGYVLKKKKSVTVLARQDLVEHLDWLRIFDASNPENWQGANGFVRGGRGGIVKISFQNHLKMVVKPLYRGGIIQLVNKSRHFSKARLFQEARLSNYLIRKKIPVPRMLIGRAEGVSPFFQKLHLGFEEICHAKNLFTLLKDENYSVDAMRRVFFKAGEAIRALHNVGVFHHDLNLGNLLAVNINHEEKETGIKIIDLDRSTFGKPLTLKIRALNLARLFRHVVKNRLNEFADFDRIWAAFLSGYCMDDLKVPDFRDEVDRLYKRSLFFHRLSWRLQGAYSF